MVASLSCQRPGPRFVSMVLWVWFIQFGTGSVSDHVCIFVLPALRAMICSSWRSEFGSCFSFVLDIDLIFVHVCTFILPTLRATTCYPLRSEFGTFNLMHALLAWLVSCCPHQLDVQIDCARIKHSITGSFLSPICRLHVLAAGACLFSCSPCVFVFGAFLRPFSVSSLLASSVLALSRFTLSLLDKRKKLHKNCIFFFSLKMWVGALRRAQIFALCWRLSVRGLVRSPPDLRPFSWRSLRARHLLGHAFAVSIPGHSCGVLM